MFDSEKERALIPSTFLKGFAPVLAAFVGIICLFIGAADIKDKSEAKKEDAEKVEA